MEEKYDDSGKNTVISDIGKYIEKYKSQIIHFPNGFKAKVVGFSLIDDNLICISDNFIEEHEAYIVSDNLKSVYNYGNYVFLDDIQVSHKEKWVIVPLPLINISLKSAV